jgi:hypothetical protein
VAYQTVLDQCLSKYPYVAFRRGYCPPDSPADTPLKCPESGPADKRTDSSTDSSTDTSTDTSADATADSGLSGGLSAGQYPRLKATLDRRWHDVTVDCVVGVRDKGLNNTNTCI